MTTGQRDKDGDGVDRSGPARRRGRYPDRERILAYVLVPSGVVERVPGDSDDPKTERPAQVPNAAFQVDPTQAKREMTKAAFRASPSTAPSTARPIARR